jgi:hypothetical protein
MRDEIDKVKDKAEDAILAKAAHRPWVLMSVVFLSGFLVGLFVGNAL